MAHGEVCQYNKGRELLAQGLSYAKNIERSQEQERAERQRQLPYHMHINLEVQRPAVTTWKSQLSSGERCWELQGDVQLPECWDVLGNLNKDQHFVGFCGFTFQHFPTKKNPGSPQSQMPQVLESAQHICAMLLEVPNIAMQVRDDSLFPGGAAHFLLEYVEIGTRLRWHQHGLSGWFFSDVLLFRPLGCLWGHRSKQQADHFESFEAGWIAGWSRARDCHGVVKEVSALDYLEWIATWIHMEVSWNGGTPKRMV